MANKDSQFDVRVIAHHIRRQETTQAAYDAHLAALPDDAEHGEPTEVTFGSSADRAAATEPEPEA